MTTRIGMPSIMDLQLKLQGKGWDNKALELPASPALLASITPVMGQYALARQVYNDEKSSNLSQEETVALGTAVCVLQMLGYHNEALCMEQHLDLMQKSKKTHARNEGSDVPWVRGRV